MFVRFDPDWPPPDPPRRAPEPPPRRLQADQEKRLLQAIAFNLALMIIAPIGGATIIGALFGWWR